MKAVLIDRITPAEEIELSEVEIPSVKPGWAPDLPWENLAAVPETCFTAWGSLFASLRLRREDTLLIRGGTCALGYAAIQLAKALGCRVIATTHRKEKLPLLRAADEAVLDTGTLSGTLSGVTKALELVGVKTLRDSLRCVGIREACIAMDSGQVNGKIVVKMPEQAG